MFDKKQYMKEWGRKRYQENKDQIDLKNKQWKDNNPEKAKAIRLKISLKRRNITIEHYEKLLQKQNGVCAICKQPEKVVLNGKTKRLAIDHNHKTGQIRGLLCDTCNRGIGYFSESTELLTTAKQYLQEYHQIAHNLS